MKSFTIQANIDPDMDSMMIFKIHVNQSGTAEFDWSRNARIDKKRFLSNPGGVLNELLDSSLGLKRQ